MPPAVPLRERVRDRVRRQRLLRPGDRVGVAVSGGADSLALLRLLLELRADLGVVLSVLHFHHGIRGAEADADQRFVAEVAANHALEFHSQAGDSPAHAAARGLSLEAAARDLRYAWFRDLLEHDVINRIATAHTLDDQAETVLMRTLRGAGSRGIAGIYPDLPAWDSRPRLSASIIRPLLHVRRGELQDYLRSLAQTWREDATNLDTRHLRNRIRHVLLPLLERDFNPRVAEVLASQAEIARAEEEFWKQQVSQHLPSVVVPDAEKKTLAFHPDALLAYPLALQRRLLLAAAESAGLRLEFADLDRLLHLAAGDSGTALDLPQGRRALRGPNNLRMEKHAATTPEARDYEYRLAVPGEVRVAEIGSVIRATLVPAPSAAAEYNSHPNASLPAKELVVRNWRAGDRFQPAHTRSPKKVKTLLQERHIAAGERRLWPVVESGGTIIWMRGFPGLTSRLRIEEVVTR
jgi:tRNA(Ile)-lysidine synthase